MYLITGGRKTQSGLFRVRYVGDKEGTSDGSEWRKSKQQIAREAHSNRARKIKRRLASLHLPGASNVTSAHSLPQIRC